MGTNHADIFTALAAEFMPHEVKKRAGAGGRELRYITARTAQNRFDEVMGPECWKPAYRFEQMRDGTEAVVCTISLRIDGEWIPKEDAGGFKEMTERNKQGQTVEDDENTAKTGFSDSFKRSAVVWGVARYLYGDGVPDYGNAPPRSARTSVSAPRSPEPRPTFTNNTGSGSGKYAPNDMVKSYQEWLKYFVDEVNSKWADHWMSESGELPNGITDLVRTFQLSNHLCKWGIAQKLFAAPEDFKVSQADRLVAIGFGINEDVFVGESRAYCLKLWAEAEAKFKAGAPGNPDADDPHNADGLGDEPAAPPPPRDDRDVPRTGKALFARLKDLEKEHGEGLVKYLNSWAQKQEFPLKIVDWDASQVKAGYAEALAAIEQKQGV